MSDSTSTPGRSEPILAAFLRDLEISGRAEDVLGDYCARYPHLAGEFEEFAHAQHLLGGSLAHGTTEPPVPDRLGDFAIVRRIAHGGMGEIYEAVQEPLGRRVAVKTIRGRERHLAGLLHARFLREQKVLAQLHHTHIVPIHAAGRAGELQFFAMPYIDGAALNHVVRTAWLHESSTPHAPTPSLAKLAAEARSRLSHETEAGLAGSRVPANSPAAGDPPAPFADPAHADSTVTVGEPPRIEVEREPGTRPAARSSGDVKLVSSGEYIRSVARVVIDAAEAVQYAHEAGIIHRDLKPANLMVDRSEHCWVLDFGLAGYLKTRANGLARTIGDGTTEAPRHEPTPPPDLGPDPPSVSGVLGTPDYMAPEQFQGRADSRTDVWGLGVILYELLTLRRPFRGRKEIESNDPPRPSDLVHRLPRDLEAVCLKALSKDPGKRYQSARELADDLKHWLKNEPVVARPAWWIRRFSLWVRRSPGWAVALGFAVLVLAAISESLIRTNKTRAESALQVAHAAEKRATAESREAQTQKREALIQQIERIRKTPHQVGWSGKLWDLVRKAADLQPDDGRVQAQAATSLAGLDAIRRKAFDFPATALAFDPSTNRLLIGGGPRLRKAGDFPLRIWDSTTDDLRTLELKAHGHGLFAFRRDGMPLYLAIERDEPVSLQLWDVSTARKLLTLTLPDPGNQRFQDWAITPDGAHVAGSAVAPDGTGWLAVWEAMTGRLLRTIPTKGVTDVALSPDGRFLAAGYFDGQTRVWNIAGGELFATLSAGRNEINCLAFGPNRVHRQGENDPTEQSRWLLAVGDAGGAVTTWDLGRKIPLSYGRESYHELFALAFSPDGMTLASAGRNDIRLWDIATGRMLLRLPAGSYIHALAFAPDGKRLAGCVEAAFASSDGVIVWELEDGRGIQTLRGLVGRISKTIFSPDGRFVAALANDWQVGVWDRKEARLLAVIEVEPGPFMDNAALAFSPDGRSLAFSGGHEASLWGLPDGRLLRAWSLPEALQESLVFLGPEQLLLYRTETASGKVGPFSGSHPKEHPRVYRIRNLLGSDPLKPSAEITDFNWHVYKAVATPDGDSLIIDGLGGSPGRPIRAVRVYNGRTGQRLGVIPTNLTQQRDHAAIRIDPTGKTATVFVGEPSEVLLLEIPSRTVLENNPSIEGPIGPGANRGFAMTRLPDDQELQILIERGRRDPLVRFFNDEIMIERFSLDGRFTCGGSIDGTVQAVDLVEVQRRLAEFGLGW